LTGVETVLLDLGRILLVGEHKEALCESWTHILFYWFRIVFVDQFQGCVCYSILFSYCARMLFSQVIIDWMGSGYIFTLALPHWNSRSVFCTDVTSTYIDSLEM
jgi:hypothetical protein